MSRAKRTGRKTATMADVAQLAAVSAMTVSRVLSGNAQVSEQTREAVLSAVRKLGYSPNPAARSLARAETLHVGVLYNNPSSSYLNEFLVGALEHSSQAGYQIVLEKCSSRNERAVLARLLKEGIDGIVLPPPLSDSRAISEVLRKSGMPFVAVAGGKPRASDLTVRINNFEAAAAMTRYLLSLGHRRIGFILGASNQEASLERYDGFTSALTGAGLSIRPEWVRKGAFSYRSGFLAAEEILRRRQRPSALFASNDDMAAGALAVAHRLGLDVPADVTVAGFDDTPLARTIWPTLTTIHQPVAAMARKALQMLIEEIRLRRIGKTSAPRQQVLRYSLVKRESSGIYKKG